MLGLIAIYFVGKYFHELANHHQRNKWGFAFAGVGVYFGGQIALGALIAILYPESFDDMTIAVNVGGLFVGALATVAFYSYLKHKWENAAEVSENPDILDDII